ncbi:MAG: GNAT family N-acetyltransferase [Bifidobacteriaceae bacterium]|jgi:phosphinothricin acetyltransferase|nr:GNAT family N-acetyltransferase [Bifidobacteriaceae bacterium]
MHIRPLLPSDWEDVAAIAREATAFSAFDEELVAWRAWDTRFIPGQRLVAASREGRIAGWTALEPVSSRPSWSGVAAVSIYVAAAFRGQGFGSRLLGGIVASAEEAGIWTLQAHVLPQNTAALHLLQDFGFARVGSRQRLFQVDDAWQDAILLDRRSPVVFADSTPVTQEIPEAS